MLRNRDEAFELLRALDAPGRLLLHAEIVSEVALLLAQLCRKFNAPIDNTLVEVGAIIHDPGKVLRVNELSEPGNKHESTGRELMQEKIKALFLRRNYSPPHQHVVIPIVAAPKARSTAPSTQAHPIHHAAIPPHACSPAVTE